MENKKTRTPEEIRDEIDRTLDKVDDHLLMAQRLRFSAEELTKELPAGAMRDKYTRALEKLCYAIDAASFSILAAYGRD